MDQGVKDLNVRPKTITFLEENIGKIHDVGLGNDLLYITPKT